MVLSPSGFILDELRAEATYDYNDKGPKAQGGLRQAMAGVEGDACVALRLKAAQLSTPHGRYTLARGPNLRKGGGGAAPPDCAEH